MDTSNSIPTPIVAHLIEIATNAQAANMGGTMPPLPSYQSTSVSKQDTVNTTPTQSTSSSLISDLDSLAEQLLATDTSKKNSPLHQALLAIEKLVDSNSQTSTNSPSDSLAKPTAAGLGDFIGKAMIQDGLKSGNIKEALSGASILLQGASKPQDTKQDPSSLLSLFDEIINSLDSKNTSASQSGANGPVQHNDGTGSTALGNGTDNTTQSKVVSSTLHDATVSQQPAGVAKTTADNGNRTPSSDALLQAAYQKLDTSLGTAGQDAHSQGLAFEQFGATAGKAGFTELAAESTIGGKMLEKA